MTATEQPQGQPVLTLYTTDANGAIVALEATRTRRYRERFWTMFHTVTSQIAKLDRPPAYHRALLACLPLMDPVQFRRISAAEVAEAAGLSTISAERALAMLEADHVILTNGRRTGAKARRLNNRLCWMATADQHNAAVQDVEVIDGRGR